MILAIYYPDARSFAEHHADELAGRIVVDITNPVNETFDALIVEADDSATEGLARLLPAARLVKAFNMTFAGPLTAGEAGGKRLDVLMAGDDEDAKARVATLVRDAGLNPIDVGPAQRARELEAAGLLHIRLQSNLGTNFGTAFQLVA